VPPNAERLVQAWIDHVGDPPRSYRDSVVGLRHELDRDLLTDALDCVRAGRPRADVTERFREPVCALTDGDLVLPPEVEEALVTVHALYRELDAR
jgi:hypothetical protein